MLEINEIKYKLQSALSPKRYAHTIGVAQTAAEMAKSFGADTKKTEIAGLLHDCAKDYPAKLKLRLSKEYHIGMSKIFEEQPDLLHSFLGAEIARREYGVTDEDILNAIAYHTTGRPNMSMLEKIIYIADCIEPNRYKYESLDTLRTLAFKDLDKAMVFALKDTISHVGKKKQALHELSSLALEYYVNETTAKSL